MVERSRGLLSFPLPILTEWFAAKSLADAPAKVEELVTQPQQLEHWRYSLVIAIATFGEEIVFKLLKPIAQSYPTFAAEVILEASTRWGGREIPLPSFKECGEQILAAMEAWVQGIGPLAPLIAPIDWGLERIPLAELEAPLAYIEEQAVQNCWIVLHDIGSGSDYQQEYYLKRLRQEITRLQSLNQSELCSPWVGPDSLQGQRLWELYSPQRLSVRIKGIYKAALDIYQQMIETKFQSLKPGLKIAAMLPARLVGNISPIHYQGVFGTSPPDFYWFLEALPEGQSNEVELSISEYYIYESQNDRMEAALQQLSFLRPESAMWIRYLPLGSHLSREHFFGHSPATALAYAWLRDDLTSVFGFGSFIRQARF